MEWHGQGLSLAEIGRRLGVSPERLRTLLAGQGVDIAALEPGSDDDDTPNMAPIR